MESKVKGNIQRGDGVITVWGMGEGGMGMGERVVLTPVIALMYDLI